jgi:hypothetical protein
MAPVPPAFAGETQGAGQWTGGGRVLLHLQRDLQQSRCGEMARRSCLLPRGLLSMTHYLNINTILSYQQLAMLGNPRTTPLRPTTKDASRAGRRRTQRCRVVPFVTASPGRLQIPVTPR